MGKVSAYSVLLFPDTGCSVRDVCIRHVTNMDFRFSGGYAPVDLEAGVNILFNKHEFQHGRKKFPRSKLLQRKYVNELNIYICIAKIAYCL